MNIISRDTCKSTNLEEFRHIIAKFGLEPDVGESGTFTDITIGEDSPFVTGHVGCFTEVSFDAPATTLAGMGFCMAGEST